MKTTGSWVLGGVASQVWTFAGDIIGANLSNLIMQPFINFNFGTGWAVGAARSQCRLQSTLLFPKKKEPSPPATVANGR